MSSRERRRSDRNRNSGDRSARIGRRTRGLYFKTAVEWLEPRCLLAAQAISGVALPTIRLALLNRPQNSATPASSGYTSPASNAYTPTEILDAYNFDQTTFSGGTVQGDGAGQTIAIIDAYLDPGITTDAATFSSYYGLPQFGSTNGPTLTVVGENSTTLPTNTDPSGDDWALETSLDVEWAHTLAPEANILLVEANSDNFSDLLAGVQYATTYSNVSVVSMSWGVPESDLPGESAYDSSFTTPAGHQGITFVSSAGDSGIPGGYPAFSPNVLSVGGTSLTLSSGSYSSETVWNNQYGSTGGGISTQEAEPVYQDSIVPAADSDSGTRRAMPDVAFDADPGTGVAIVDSYDYGSSTPWIPGTVGGTSFGAPAWAALVAVADQGRAIAGLGSLDGPSQTLPEIYAMPAANFHDITTGSEGSVDATAGYDLLTGRGTPIVSSVVGYLDAFSVTATSPTVGSTQQGALTSFTVTFSDTYSNSGLVASDFKVNGTAANSFTDTSATSITFTFSTSPVLTNQSAQTMTIAAGAIDRAADGSPLVAFTGTFYVPPTGLISGIPAGSMVYETSADGSIATLGEVDEYTLSVAAGQTITAIVVPGTLPFTELSLRGPKLSKSASGAGEDVILQTVSVSTAGTFTFRVYSLNGDTGTFTLEVFLNAAVSTSAIGLGTNNQLSSSQSIAASFESTGPTANRAAVVGETGVFSPASLSDYYSFTLAAAQTVTLAVTDQSGAAGTIDVSLLNSSGTTLAAGTPMTTNVDGAVENFTATTAGTYYADVTGSTSNITYVLVVTRGADFDLKANSTEATAQNITGTVGVLGAIVAAAPTDWYAVNLAAGAGLTLQTYTFGGTTANNEAFIDSVQPRIQLFSPSGTLLAPGTGSTNQSLVEDASVAGTYYIEVTGGSGSTGEYFLGISTGPAVSITPISPNPTNAAVSQMQIVFNGSVSGMSLAHLSLSFNGGPNLLTGSQTLTTSDDKTFTLGNLAQLTGTNGVYTLSVAASSGITNQNTISLQTGASTTFTVDTTPPVVEGVYVSSTAWSQTFLNYLVSQGIGSAQLGYLIPAGANQLQDLPWVNITTISVVFNENVSTNMAGSVPELIGSPDLPAPAALSSAAFTLSGHTAQWTFSSPLPTDQYLLNIPSAYITDTLGSTLDGEWTTSSSKYPSGNGTAGGDFNFQFNIVQADVNQDGVVTGLDGNDVRLEMSQNTTTGGYSPFYDLIGSGTITTADTSDVRLNLEDRLPATAPSIPGGGSGDAVTATLPSGTDADAVSGNSAGDPSALLSPESHPPSSSALLQVLAIGNPTGANRIAIGALSYEQLASGSWPTALKMVTVQPATIAVASVAPAGESRSTVPVHAANSASVAENPVPSIVTRELVVGETLLPTLPTAPAPIRPFVEAEEVTGAEHIAAPVPASSSVSVIFAALAGPRASGPINDPDTNGLYSSLDNGDDLPSGDWLADLVLEHELDWLNG